jgi:hypothetical protein
MHLCSMSLGAHVVVPTTVYTHTLHTYMYYRGTSYKCAPVLHMYVCVPHTCTYTVSFDKIKIPLNYFD